jgi:hypothetical protein
MAFRYCALYSPHLVIEHDVRHGCPCLFSRLPYGNAIETPGTDYRNRVGPSLKENATDGKTMPGRIATLGTSFVHWL